MEGVTHVDNEHTQFFSFAFVACWYMSATCTTGTLYLLLLRVKKASIFRKRKMRMKILFILSCFYIVSACRSNETHIAWRTEGHSSICTFQTLAEAERDAYHFLLQHIMEFDRPQSHTLGFSDEGAADGLDGGLIGPTIKHSLNAKVLFEYTDRLPKRIWRNYILNYASTNEARSNWRDYLTGKLQTHFHTFHNLTETVTWLNTHVWEILAPAGHNSIIFHASQTPLIFDPMSVLIFGYASCTGLAILFVAILRTAGIPARVAGTPAWQQNVSHGNHNWVEVYRNQVWYFIEPSPAQSLIDTLDRNPCERWFCNPGGFPSSPSSATKVFAASLESNHVYYPMAWEPSNPDVPGIDRSDFYQHVCGECPTIS